MTTPIKIRKIIFLLLWKFQKTLEKEPKQPKINKSTKKQVYSIDLFNIDSLLGKSISSFAQPQSNAKREQHCTTTNP